MTYPKALAFVLAAEGGYVDDPADRGGCTNCGITQRTFSAWLASNDLVETHVREITGDEVADIYRSHYWDAAHCDDLPDALAFVHFDAAVQHGPGQAAKFLQAAVGVVADGAIGPATLAAASRADVATSVRRYIDRRHAFYDALVARDRTQGRFLKGWLNRLTNVETEALA